MYIGIDLGGTKTEVVCLDNNGDELFRQRVRSPQQNYSETITTIHDLVKQAEGKLQQSGSVGVGIPGSICNNTQLVKNSNSTWLNGRPFKKDLETALSRPVRLENDANCFTVSEAISGAGKKHKLVFGAILGTGCGGGIVVDGKLLVGANGLSGEWGHNPLPFPRLYRDPSIDIDSSVTFFDQGNKVERSAIYERKKTIELVTTQLEEAEYPGPLCYCGKRGCLETWISGSGLSRDYQRVSGDDLPAIDIVKQAQASNTSARSCLERYYERLAKSLAQIVNIVDPDIIVCGGGMSNIPALYTEVPARWDKYIFSSDSKTEIAQAHHGDSSGVRGAALLWKK